VPIISGGVTIFDSRRSQPTTNEMTSASDKADGVYVRLYEFLRRDEYDSWLTKERELLNVFTPILTREQWLACSEPFAMLALLQDVAPERELRAFCCACCRRMWLTHNATETVMLDALRIAEAFAAGQASREEMHGAHQSISRRAKEAGDWFTRVNMKLGDSTDKWDFVFAAYDYRFAEALSDATDDDIGYSASRCISHALEVVHIKPGLAGKKCDQAARAGEEKAQADMIRQRWHYPAESAHRLLETHRYRDFRVALAAKQELADEQWRIVNWFAVRMEDMDGESLKQLCHEQISALAGLLPPAIVQHILFDNLARILSVSVAGPWRSRWRGLSRPQLFALPSNRLGDLITDHLQGAPPGALERWCCSLLFDQLTAVAFARIGRPPAGWPKAHDFRTLLHEYVSTLLALLPRR
jgi:hypothetical protein